MTRRKAVLTVGVSILVALIVVAALLLVGASRARQLITRGATPPGSEAAPLPASTGIETPRGDVTIDARRQQLIGVRTARATRALAAPSIRAVGMVRYDETRLKEINLKVDGWIRHLDVDYTGRRVRKGDPLFTFYSPEILATEREYLLAMATRDALAESRAQDVRQHAEQLVAAARQRLALWDIPPSDLAALEDSRNPQGTVVFRSPFEGVVLDKQALEGMHVTAGQTLYKVADLSTVWVEADVAERDATSVRVGTPATVTVDAYPGEHFAAKTVFIYPTLNEETRTLKARLALPNPRERLKPGMYAQVELRSAAASALVVPMDAVLDSGTEQVVFLAQGDGRFQPRRVKTGRRLPEGAEILEGLEEGDEVATSAAFFLDSERQLLASLKDNAASSAQATTAAPAVRLDIALRTEPNPLKVGENAFEVAVKDARGAPIADADVSLQFYMPAMPTMNMPAMRNTVKLAPAGGGVYRGTGEVLMGGRWDVTVSVTRQGQSFGSKQMTVVAR